EHAIRYKAVAALHPPAFPFHPAASSPSSRKVRHLGLPPALTNSSKGVARGSKPPARKASCSFGQPVLVTTVRSSTTALHAKRAASSSSTSISSSTASASARRA